MDVLARAIGADAADAERVMGAASAMVERYAPTAPQSIKNEAVIRCAGALQQSDFGGVASEEIGGRKVDPTHRNRRAVGVRFDVLAQWRFSRRGERDGRVWPRPRQRQRRGAATFSFGGRRGDALALEQRRRRGAAAPYSDAVLAAILSDSRGGDRPRASTTGAVEAAASLAARAFASATVTPDVPAVTPLVLSTIGREIVRRGECLYLD